MNCYTYQSPYVKSATVQLEIFDASNGKIGTIQRHYKTIFHSLFDMFCGRHSLLVSFKAFDARDIQVIKTYKKNYWIAKPDYYIEFLEGELKGSMFHACQKNFDVLNAEFKIISSNIEIHTKKSIMDGVKFYENGYEIGRWHSVIKEKFKTYIEVEEIASIQDPLFYAVLGQMLILLVTNFLMLENKTQPVMMNS
ncbi:hypothetical protein AAGS61_09380 [Lysinibacillus sp. KU-BSD001]|uniref:tubby C-terminal domain-like protein n=1 Tax=Lysinibacillus sp. KU-BSD001 TaxID=3141328 RepID=UPI0036EC96E8